MPTFARPERTTVGATTRYTPRKPGRDSPSPTPGARGSPTPTGGTQSPTPMEATGRLSPPSSVMKIPGVGPVGGIGPQLHWKPGRPDTALGADPVLCRREGSQTFLPGIGARPATIEEEFDNPASPTSRGGRKFLARRPPSPPSPPALRESLTSSGTYFGSTTSLLPPATSSRRSSQARFSPPPAAEEEVSPERAAKMRQGQVLRRLRKKLVNKYGDWRCPLGGPRTPKRSRGAWVGPTSCVAPALAGAASATRTRTLAR